MNIIKTRIEIGLNKPFRALHISDNHISFADGRDDERKQALAATRRAFFDGGSENTTRYLDEQLAYARANGLPVLHTGDMIDFVSWQNLEFAREKLETVDYFMAVGNHEFSLYVGEAWEDVPYKMQSFDKVQAHFRNDLYFASRVMDGVNFVAADNGYYRFDKKQLEQLRKEAAKGLPIVLMIHNPLHTDDLYRYVMEELKQPCGYLTGTPDALLAGYDDYRFRQQKPDEDTLAFMEYVYGEPTIRAVLSGHLHYDFETRLPSGVMQYVTGAGYRGCAREIEFV